jgi:hypothetical protein
VDPLFPAVNGDYLDPHNFRNRTWKPAQIPADIKPFRRIYPGALVRLTEPQHPCWPDYREGAFVAALPQRKRRHETSSEGATR